MSWQAHSAAGRPQLPGRLDRPPLLGCMAEALSAFAALPAPRLCLDLRTSAHFARAHVPGAAHVDGLDALRSRFSTLPPRGTPFLVVCEAEALADAARVFTPPERWAIVGIVAVGSIDSVAHVPDGATHPVVCLSHDAFAMWPLACATGADARTDEPNLLFAPAPVVARALHTYAPARVDGATCVLDVGCGAGRDLTYWLRHAPRGAQWRATALDRWRAALLRAAQLLQDHALLAPALNGTLGSTRDDSAAPALCEAMLVRTIDVAGHVREGTETLPLAACLPRRAYDVVLLIRFWHMSLLEQLPEIVAPGGIVVISHFVHEPARIVDAVHRAPTSTTFESPPVDARIHVGDVAHLLCIWRTHGAWDVLENVIEPVEDGRPVQSVVVRRNR